MKYKKKKYTCLHFGIIFDKVKSHSMSKISIHCKKTNWKNLEKKVNKEKSKKRQEIATNEGDIGKERFWW